MIKTGFLNTSVYLWLNSWWYLDMLEKGDFPLYCTKCCAGIVDMFVCFQPNRRSQKQGKCLWSSSLVFRSRFKCVVIIRKISSRGKICTFVIKDVWIVYTKPVVTLLGSRGLWRQPVDTWLKAALPGKGSWEATLCSRGSLHQNHFLQGGPLQL